MATPNSNWVLSVGGWNGTSATFGINNGAVSSMGGLHFGSVQGFSQTAGGGDYGYYCIDLGAIHHGTLHVDMSIHSNGMGFWHIVNSENPFDASGGNSGLFDSTASQIWSSQQDASWGQIFPFYVVPVKAVANFHGRYIYIGATDLALGQLALAIQNVVVS